jgi:hypothetical protein
MQQYWIALRNWLPGREVLALAHLYMGMEALTKAALRRERTKHGCTSDQALVKELGIEKKELDGFVRRETLFQGDGETYRAAKAASDGFEHGFLSLADVHSLASQARDRTGELLRMAIFDAGGLEKNASEILLGEKYGTPHTRGW